MLAVADTRRRAVAAACQMEFSRQVIVVLSS